MNKKLIAALAASCAIGSFASAQVDNTDLSISATVGFESEYVFRGKKKAPGSAQVSVEASVAGFYAGAWMNQPVFESNGVAVDNEVDLYAGYGFAVSELVELDVGVTLYTYPETPGPAGSETVEAYIGGAFDVFLSPSLYIYRDFDLKTWTAEFSMGHTIDLADAAPGTTLEIGGTLGYVDVKGSNDYVYAGATADLKYSFTDNAAFAIGVRVSKNDIDRTMVAHRSNFWWGASFTAGF